MPIKPPETPQGAIAFAAKGIVALPVLPARFYDKNGEFEVTPEVLAAMVSAFEADGGANRPQTVDLNHASYYGVYGGQSDNQCSYGDIVGLAVQDTKLERSKGACLWAFVIFNDDAKKLIATNKYRYVSAEFSTEARTEGTGEPSPRFYRFTLTNTPFVEDLPPIQDFTKTAFAAFSRENTNLFAKPDEGIMSDKPTAPVTPVANDKPETVVLSKADHADILSKLATAQADTVALSATVKAMKDASDAREAALFDRDLAAILDSDKSKGKVTPANRDDLAAFGKAFGVERLTAFIANLGNAFSAGAPPIAGNGVAAFTGGNVKSLTRFELARQIAAKDGGNVLDVLKQIESHPRYAELSAEERGQ